MGNADVAEKRGVAW